MTDPAIKAALASAERHGAGSGGAVLLHAAGSSPRALRGLARVVTGIAGRTIAPPLPMTVCSIAGAHPLARQIAIARAALDELADGKRFLFGHSFGGLVAILALLDGARPDAVVLYDPIVLACLDDADAADNRARAWDRALIDRLASATAAGEPEPGLAGFIEAYNEVAWTDLPEPARRALVAEAPAMVALTRTVHHLPLDLAELAALEVPVLLLGGSRSPEVTQRMAARLAARLPCAGRSTVEGAGHMGPVLAADRVGTAIAAFPPGTGM